MIELTVLLTILLLLFIFGFYKLGLFSKDWIVINTCFIVSFIFFGLGIADTIEYYSGPDDISSHIEEMHDNAQFSIRHAKSIEQAKLQKEAFEMALEKCSYANKDFIAKEKYLIPGPFNVIILCLGISGIFCSFFMIVTKSIQ